MARLKRAVTWQHHGEGSYTSHDQMHAVKKAGKRKWERGVRQPYNLDGQYDYKSGGTFTSLDAAQSQAENEEAEQPRVNKMRTPFHDRKGL